MSPRWESNTFAKIHECCGGLIRWVEAVDNPHVGFTGECLECGDEEIPMEHMIPIRTDPGETGMDLYNRAGIETLRELEWDNDDEWNHNQKRIRKKIDAAGFPENTHD